MRAIIKIIVTLIVGMAFFNSHASTTMYYQSTDPLFGEYAEYLNSCAAKSDKEAIKEFNEDNSSLIGFYSTLLGHWHLLKMETIDGSPIDEFTRNELEKITFGCGKDHFVVNGSLTIPWENKKSMNLNSISQSSSFVDNYLEFVTYFEKSYSKMGIPVSFDNIKVICASDDNISSWLKCFSICDFALIGDWYHCCLIINQKYVLWFSKYKVLVTEYELGNYPSDMKDPFFEDPIPNIKGLQIDTTMSIIASDKTCYSLNEWAKDVDITDYYHLIVDGGNRYKYLGDLEELSVTVLPNYKGYQVIYVSCGEGYDNLHFGQLVVYSDLKEINKKSDRLNVECNYGGCEDDEAYGEGRCRHLNFDIFEDYTIRVKGRLVDPETNVDKEVTRYYRIDDNGKFYELTNSAENDSPIACQSQLDTLDYGKEKENTNAKADENEEVRFPLYLLLGMAAVLLVFVVVFLKKKKK